VLPPHVDLLNHLGIPKLTGEWSSADHFEHFCVAKFHSSSSNGGHTKLQPPWLCAHTATADLQTTSFLVELLSNQDLGGFDAAVHVPTWAAPVSSSVSLSQRGTRCRHDSSRRRTPTRGVAPTRTCRPRPRTPHPPPRRRWLSDGVTAPFSFVAAAESSSSSPPVAVHRLRHCTTARCWPPHLRRCAGVARTRARLRHPWPQTRYLLANVAVEVTHLTVVAFLPWSSSRQAAD
jgi:hypothetical protein